ncbi:cone-rod homeobox protein-like [Orycteropus afer afer]|uniref:Cone-rod homeobox protein-like n=1 Tax=Orycteropus afer afer TaxID=1230840 RepID=A0A8B6ZZU4_ORYAF|nr:cone-rod homeobox protein-like [Orycteropus afer afer]
MLKPYYLHDPEPSHEPPRRRRQERTVYTREQLRELQTFFEKNKYPEYDERVALAARLHVQQHQVWFKNRRAKHAQQQRYQLLPSPGREDRGAPGMSPAPSPESPAFPEGPGSCSLFSLGLRPMSPAAEPAGSSPGQAYGACAPGAQWGAPTTTVSVQDPCAMGFPSNYASGSNSEDFSRGPLSSSLQRSNKPAPSLWMGHQADSATWLSSWGAVSAAPCNPAEEPDGGAFSCELRGRGG